MPDISPSTASFKVFGAKFHFAFHQSLKAAYHHLYNLKGEIKALLQPEPDNPADKNAILVQLDYGQGFKSVGYIAREMTKFIHPLLTSGDIYKVSLKHISFSLVFSDIGYYLAINITKSGPWDQAVVRHSKGVH